MQTKNKRIAITGHSEGLGRGLYKHFVLHNHCLGFDLTNGYDISKDSDQIIAESLDCDIFINNAYYYDYQIEIAKKWHQAHWDKDHLLINISSLIAEPLLEGEKIFPHLKPHIDEKQKLNQASFEINSSDSRCKSVTIMPGILNTGFRTPYDLPEDPEISKLFWTKILEKGTILEVYDIVDVIDWVADDKNPRRIISSITIRNR
jgi:NADP-dependent 3-hydroxy acid dehydrogenase YdfG